MNNNEEKNNSIPVNNASLNSFENIYGETPTMSEAAPNPFGNQQPIQNNINMNQAPTMTEATPNSFGNQQPMQNNMNTNPTNSFDSNKMVQSNINIDKEKMQSIEEQLSKTSQYNPEEFQQEKITIPEDNQYEKNKSGLSFVIALFVILALVIAFLPQLTKLIK